MHLKERKCGKHCYTPTNRRLALFNTKDEYECYAEGYVKCFWRMCDQHKSIESFANTANQKVITRQPVPRELSYQTPGIIQSILITN